MCIRDSHSPEDALPYVLNFSAGKVRGETMLHFLAQREVYVLSLIHI